MGIKGAHIPKVELVVEKNRIFCS